MLKTSSATQLKDLEEEIEFQKSRLDQAIRSSSDEIRKIIPPGSLPEYMIGNLVQEYPFPALAILFAGGFIAVQIFREE